MKICLNQFFILAVLLIFNCSNINDESKIIINFNNAPAGSRSAVPDNIKNIHIAVFENFISSSTFLTRTSMPAAGTVTVHVPPGEKRIILVVAEDENGYACSNGFSEPINLKPNEITSVYILIVDIDLNIGFDFGSTPWDGTEGADFYTLDKSAAESDADYSMIYQGTDTSYPDGTFGYWYRVRAYFQYCELNTMWFKIQNQAG